MEEFEEMGQGVVRQSYNRLASDAVIDRFLDMLASSWNPISQTRFSVKFAQAYNRLTCVTLMSEEQELGRCGN